MSIIIKIALPKYESTSMQYRLEQLNENNKFIFQIWQTMLVIFQHIITDLEIDILLYFPAFTVPLQNQ